MRLVALDPEAGWGIADLPDGCELVRRSADDPGPLDGGCVVVAFFRAAVELVVLAELAPQLWPATALWAAWPRRAGGHRSDITDVVVRTTALALGLVDNKVAAIDADWSGLRLVWRRELRDRPPSGRAD